MLTSPATLESLDTDAPGVLRALEDRAALPALRRVRLRGVPTDLKALLNHRVLNHVELDQVRA